MPLVYTPIASGSSFHELVNQAQAIDEQLAGLPSGEQLELRFEIRQVEFAGVDWTKVFVEGAVAAINAVDGLARWAWEQIGRPLRPWPGEQHFAFGWFDDSTKRWTLAIRWQTASAWLAVVVRFLAQVAITIVAAGVVVWLADAVIGWTLSRVEDRAGDVGRILTHPVVLVALALWFFWPTIRAERGR